MTESNHCPPLSGPASDPIRYGVARALAHLFPPIHIVHGGKDNPETLTDKDPAEGEVGAVTIG